MNRIKKAFTLFTAIIPIASMYATPIPGINLAEIVLMFFWVIYACTNFRRILRVFWRNPNIYIVYFVIFILIMHLFVGVRYGIDVDALVRTIRFSFYYMSAIALGSRWIDYGGRTKRRTCAFRRLCRNL